MKNQQKALKLKYGCRLGERIDKASPAKQRILKTHRSKPKKVNWWYRKQMVYKRINEIMAQTILNYRDCGYGY